MSKQENEEIVFNLWYIYGKDGIIYSLRARAYVGHGTDEDKLSFLKEYAKTDYLIAQPFSVPKNFHTTFLETGTGDEKRLPIIHHSDIDALGGPIKLFDEAFTVLEKQLPSQTKLSISQKPLVCLTPLLGDDEGNILPLFDGNKKL